ncbi:hypothetical protein N7456_012085 [Penicillium angulare]|uniref:Fungal N-terminal domain-containing protein n=1 Tax=Penicillium angulare TaxID=116970 RepID=A0A9W9K0B7_9EURO|nr:hypothetical protein N7456_012085 [Penicillium angulare]
MADPFSVASGAIGIISLGIEVSGRIVSYCQAWQDYGDDIQRFGAKADSVRTLLKRVRELLEEIRITDPEIAGDMERTVADLQMKVEQLHETLQRYRPALDSGPKRLRTQLKKAAHPFRKDTLNKMWHDLDDMEQSLQIALNLLRA